MDINAIFQSRGFKLAAISVVAVLILLGILKVGITVGYAKARFSYQWAENYHKNFAGPAGGFAGDWWRSPSAEYTEGHGAFGEVLTMQESGFAMRGRGDIEKSVLIDTDTTVRRGHRSSEETNDLSVGDYVVVVGSPNEEGQIVASLIRIFEKDSTAIRKSPRRRH